MERDTKILWQDHVLENSSREFEDSKKVIQLLRSEVGSPLYKQPAFNSPINKSLQTRSFSGSPASPVKSFSPKNQVTDTSASLMLDYEKQIFNLNKMIEEQRTQYIQMVNCTYICFECF